MIKKIIFLLVVLTVFFGCENPVDPNGGTTNPDTGAIKVVLPGAASGAARAAYSEAPASYSVTVADPATSFSTTKTGAAGATIVVNSLKPATYTVTVKGLDADSVEIMDGSTSTVVVAGETADASVQLNYTAGGLNVDVILPSVDNPVVLGPQRIKSMGPLTYTYDETGNMIRVEKFDTGINAYEIITINSVSGLREASEYFEFNDDPLVNDFVKVADGVFSHDAEGREVTYTRTYLLDSIFEWHYVQANGIAKVSVSYDDVQNTKKIAKELNVDGISSFVLISSETFDSKDRIIEEERENSLGGLYWLYYFSNNDYSSTVRYKRIATYHGDTDLIASEQIYKDDVLQASATISISSQGFYDFAEVRDSNGLYKCSVNFGSMKNHALGYIQNADVHGYDWANSDDMIVYRKDLKPLGTIGWYLNYEDGTAVSGQIYLP